MFSRPRVTVISEDTDVLVLLLHYFEKFHSLGLQNLFLQLGKGEKRRMLPVHIMFERFGKDFSQEILSAHLATGSDHLSKVGSKRCALRKVFAVFGKTATLDEEQLKVAEEYLVNVLSASNGVKTFDELRVQVHKKTGSALATLADVKLGAKLNIVFVLKWTVPNAQTFVLALIAKINKIIMILLLGYFYYL